MFEQLSESITARVLDGLSDDEIAVLMKALTHIRERLLV